MTELVIVSNNWKTRSPTTCPLKSFSVSSSLVRRYCRQSLTTKIPRSHPSRFTRTSYIYRRNTTCPRAHYVDPRYQLPSPSFPTSCQYYYNRKRTKRRTGRKRPQLRKYQIYRIFLNIVHRLCLHCWVNDTPNPIDLPKG